VTGPTSSMACAGCGSVLAGDDPYPFRCPNAGRGDDVDHVVARVLDGGGLTWAELVDEDANPFVRYRRLFHSWHLAARKGMADEDYVDLVRTLDKEVAGVDGKGFEVTPLERAGDLSARLGFAAGGVWVKDETGNVSGSHKARHMMGLLIHLAVVERLGLAPDGADRDLAIASCGNAALAAAVVARAGGRSLRVFVPTWGDPGVVARLRGLGAMVNVIPREAGVPGDPTYLALQRAIAGGALPFTCQGNENGLVIEGGMTLGYELASQLAEDHVMIDRLFVQVGGGALASAVIQGLREAVALGAGRRLPRLHTVQTEGGYPLARAYDRLAERVTQALGIGGASEQDRANQIAGRFTSPPVQGELRHAASHRSEFMWPWEHQPKSIAHGILDDETYDWLAVVKGLLETGGSPITADEQTLMRANDLARSATGIDVDHTGSSGLAGLVALRDRGGVGEDEKVAVLFTGVRRQMNQEGGGRR
jgi:threonine synthase